ncbi:hypothetical protein RVS70_05065 [Virgibacillus sp. M23]|uniref:hypothetical protein n=1 Tax=Virgibacillus sp. M23 TaxID=3079030 RepID=UPI002A9160BE|nr:hypothetical protein [Virgibacillus sp. M23]MDY7043570.1 hypothetical protein [Virgibacillus sp. M23]
MFVGRILYVLGILFVFVSVIVLIMMLFTNKGNMLTPVFTLLNGFIAIGIGDVVIDLNYKKRRDRSKE